MKWYEDERPGQDSEDGIEECSDDTRTTFEAGVKAVEKEIQQYHDRLERLTEKPGEALNYAEHSGEAEDYYTGVLVDPSR